MYLSHEIPIGVIFFAHSLPPLLLLLLPQYIYYFASKAHFLRINLFSALTLCCRCRCLCVPSEAKE
jgi:hypothetical protein